MKHSLLCAVILSIALSSCGDNQPQQIAQAPVQTPVVVQQDSTDPLLAAGVGAAAGYMLGKSNSPSYHSAPRHVIVQKNVTVINKTYQRPIPRSVIVSKPRVSSKPKLSLKKR